MNSIRPNHLFFPLVFGLTLSLSGPLPLCSAESLKFSGELTAPTEAKASHDSPQTASDSAYVPTRVSVETKPSSAWRADVKKILHRLVGDDLHAFLGYAPDLAILETPSLEAYVTSSGSLSVSHGMLVFLNSESEFAFLIAHELAHVMLEHHEHRSQGNHQEFMKQELEADKLALKLVTEAGFSTSAALHLIQRLGNFGREQGLAMEELYPSLRTRRIALQSSPKYPG